MSDIFVSYANADMERVKPLVELLEKQGWSVWWDRIIPLGKTFDQFIEEALDAAKCVVVVWSRNSVNSDWVKAEATEGLKRRVLVPILIDEVKIPLEFRRIQAAQLTDWPETSTHPEINRLFESIRAIVGESKGKKEFLAGLREQMLLARSIEELRKALYATDEFLTKYPSDLEGRVLKDQIEQAILKIKREAKPIAYEMPILHKVFKSSWRIVGVGVLILLITLILVFSGLFDCWFSEDFYRGYAGGKIEISTDNSRASEFFYGKISNVPRSYYEKLKVVIYVGVKNDAWNIHPEKDSFSEVREGGLWNIPWVQRGVKKHRPEKVCAFLIPKKCVSTPEIIKSFNEIKHAVISPIYTIIGDSSLVETEQFK